MKTLIQWFLGLFFKRSSSSGEQYDSLDGLRGVAVMFVVLSHMCNENIFFHKAVNFSGSGRYGVFLFFVLSAYLLTRQFVGFSNSRLSTNLVWGNYALRRFLRIYPLYIVVLLFSCFSTKYHQPYHLPVAFNQFWPHIWLERGSSLLWTIPVEFKYYFVLPAFVIAFVFMTGRRAGMMLFITIAILVLLTEVTKKKILGGPESFYPCLPIFFLGSYGAVLDWSLEEHMQKFETLKAKIALSAICLIALALVFITIPHYYGKLFKEVDIHYFHSSFLYFGIIWTVFLLAQKISGNFINKFLSLRIIRYVGIVSFSVYLWHLPIVKYFKTVNYVSGPEKALLTLGAIFLVSTISYLLIERPFMQIKILKPKKIDQNSEAE